LRTWFRVLGASARLDLRRGVLGVEIGHIEIFRVERLDGLGEAFLGLCNACRKQEACEKQECGRTQQMVCGHAGAFSEVSDAARGERAISILARASPAVPGLAGCGLQRQVPNEKLHIRIASVC
jgi:hypothetical protein